MAASDNAGVYRYEDILRAIGHFIDEHDLQDVVILQTDQGILLRGYHRPRPGDPTPTSFVNHTFTSDEISRIHEASKRRRGTGSKLLR
jgi:hypothetical protein